MVRKITNCWYFLAVVTAVALGINSLHFASWWVSKTQAFQGGVVGLFSGIMVGMVVFLTTKYFELRTKRLNALVHIEAVLNNLLASLSDNQYQVRNAVSTDAPLLIYPTPMLIGLQDFLEIGRRDLKNKLLEVSIDSRKYAESLAHGIKIFEANIDALKGFRSNGAKEELHETINNLWQQFKKKLRDISEFGERLQQDMQSVLIDTRFFLVTDRLSRITINPYYDQKALQRWRQEDSERLKKELNVQPMGGSR